MDNTILLVIIGIVTAGIYWLIRHDSRKNAIREATQEVYKDWCSENYHQLRKYFYKEFLPKCEEYKGKGFKEIDDEKIRSICYFFDRVGWLGAAGLVDIDYILGPMQHFIRLFWLTLKPFIIKERTSDPVHFSGFEWLYLRTENKHQAELIRNKFKNPRLITKEETQKMKEKIDNHENKFRKDVGIEEKKVTIVKYKVKLLLIIRDLVAYKTKR